MPSMSSFCIYSNSLSFPHRWECCWGSAGKSTLIWKDHCNSTWSWAVLQGLTAKTFSHINLQQVTSWCCHWHGADSKSYSCLLPSWTICWQTPGLSLALLHWSIFGARLSGMSELCCLLWKWKNKGDLSHKRVLQRGRYTNVGVK